MFPTRCPSLVLLFSVAFCFVHAGPQFVAPPNATKATDQQQLITSYIPVLTVCPVGQDTSPHAVSTSQPPAALPSGWNTMHRRQPAPYYTNTSITAAAPSDSCSTSYSPRVTPFCGPQPTSCSPFVTFSTDHGYKLVTSRLRNQSATNLVPTIETLTTYYAASALALATGVPRGLVQQEVCSEGGCDDPQWESWAPFTVREVDIRNSTVQVSASVSRPAQLIIPPDITVTRSIEVVPTTVRLSTVLQNIRTVTRIEISKSTAVSSAPSDEDVDNDEVDDYYEEDEDDDDDFTSTTTLTSTMTNYRVIQTASPDQY